MILSSIVALLSGAIFSIGLGVSGMVNPNVVRGFLDISGSWNYALVLVMVGAISIGAIFFRLIKKKGHTFSGESLDLPSKTKIDFFLILGAVLFGIGWGMTGVCPGPAIANLFLFNPALLTFIVSMLGGMVVYKYTLGKK
jgi:uncharacterized membrane protein YedE/YeeE